MRLCTIYPAPRICPARWQNTEHFHWTQHSKVWNPNKNKRRKKTKQLQLLLLTAIHSSGESDPLESASNRLNISRLGFFSGFWIGQRSSRRWHKLPNPSLPPSQLARWPLFMMCSGECLFMWIITTRKTERDRTA